MMGAAKKSLNRLLRCLRVGDVAEMCIVDCLC